VLVADELLKGKIPGAETGISVRKSICTICDPQTQCGLDVYVKDEIAVKVEGSKENPHSQGTLCSKGAATRQYVYHTDRIKTPLKRIGDKGSGEFQPISWDEALDTVAEKLNNHKAKSGPESVIFFAGYTKWMRLLLHRLAHSFGSPNYCTESSTCMRAMAMAWNLVFGTPAGPDIKNAACVLVWSANPFYSNTCLTSRLMDAKELGTKFIVVDPRLTPTAAMADIHLQLKPGTDGALALGMANVIINEGLYDQAFVAEHTHGFNEYREYVSLFTPEYAAELTGVPADKICAAARMYAVTKPAAFMPSAAPVVHHTNGVQNYRAAMSLIALTGNYDIPGGNIVMPKGYLQVSSGFSTRDHEFAMSKAWDEMAPRVGQQRFPLWCDLVDEGQSMDIPRQIVSGTPYPINAIMAFGMNYRMWPDSEGFLETLKKLDFFVNVDLFMTDTCKYADIVLPASSSIERSELRCYPQNYIIFTQPAIEPLYDSRSDADIIFELARRLKLKDPLFDAGYEAALDWILEPAGLTIGELKKRPGGMSIPNPIKQEARKYLQGGFKTPTGKVEFVSKMLEKYSQSHGYDSYSASRLRELPCAKLHEKLPE